MQVLVIQAPKRQYRDIYKHRVMVVEARSGAQAVRIFKTLTTADTLYDAPKVQPFRPETIYLI